MWPNQQFPAGLVTFTEKPLMENLIFLCTTNGIHSITMDYEIIQNNFGNRLV